MIDRIALVPDGPGLGIAFDEEALAAHVVS